MIDWLTLAVAQERYKDLLREAERERFVRQALAEQEKPEPFYCQALIWLGRRLVASGQHLQERYGPVMEAPALKPPRYSR
jgi:hypothetical protein